MSPINYEFRILVKIVRIISRKCSTRINLEYGKLIQSIRLTSEYDEAMPHRYQSYTSFNNYYS